MNKIKSISKRTIALVLSMLMLLSSGIVGTLAANVELAPVGADITSDGTARLYFNMSAVSWWTAGSNGNGNFAYFFNSSTNAWSAHAVQYSGNTYYVVIPSGTWSTVILTRNNTSTSPSWDNKWNQTGNITLSSTSNYISKFSENSTSVTWGTAIKPASTASLSASASTVAPNTAVTLTSSLSSNAGLNTIKSTTYSVSPSSGASVSGNTFTATTAGAYTVTATVTYYPNGYSSLTSTATASTTITVTDPKYTYSVTAGTGGTVSPENGSVDKGKSVNITATPNTGYSFEKWTATNGTVGSTTSASTTFTPSANDANAHATFKINQYTVNFYNGDTFLEGVSANYNTAFKDVSKPTATKDSTNQYNYTFKNWVDADGNVITDTTPITGDINVYATFNEVLRSYTVNLSGTNGSVSASYVSNGQTITVNDGDEVPYGTVLNLTATPDKFYSVGTWSSDVSAVANNKYTVIGNVTLTHTFAEKTTHLVRINQSGGSGDINATYDASLYDVEDLGVTDNDNIYTHTFKVEQGANLNITVTAPSGYYISRADGANYGYDHIQITYNVENVGEQKNQNVFYTALPTYNVTVSANDNTMGTVTGGNDAVIHGNKVHLTATPQKGYYFVNWTINGTYSPAGMDLTLANISVNPQENLTATANFAPVSGTITFAAGEGGTVTNAGTHTNVTYPAIQSSKAEPSVEGYLFTGWIVTGGEEGVDYEFQSGSATSANISLRILEDGANITATANFQNASKVTVYTYTDNGFNQLTLTQSNGNNTEDITDVFVQNPVKFGDKTWYTPGEITMTGGYTDAVFAELSSGESVSDETVIYVKLSNNWITNDWGKGKDPYMAITGAGNASYSNKINASDSSGISRVNGTSYYSPGRDTAIGDGIKVSEGIYKWTIPSDKLTQLTQYGFTIYSHTWTANDTWQIDIAHCAYNSSRNYYVISETYANAVDVNNNNENRNTACFNMSANSTDFPTTTGEWEVTGAFYDANGKWIVQDGEVWLYIKDDGTYVASNRRSLTDYLASGTVVNTYNNRVNDVGWQDPLWQAFLEEYDAAVAGLGDPETTTAQAIELEEALAAAIGDLKKTDNITLIGSPGAVAYGTDQYFGDIKFFTKDEEGNETEVAMTPKTDGEIGITTGRKYYITTSFKRDADVTVRTTLTAEYLAKDYIVYGWVVNGTEWVQANEIDKANGIFEGTYTCSNNATFTPVYFRRGETDPINNTNIVKVYAKLDLSGTKWGNYISAYTWFDGDYRQFGLWNGQVMIPDDSKENTYYTFVEKTNPDDSSPVRGITFTNYGGNTGVTSISEVQTYDYYEFMELSEQGNDVITFQLKEKVGGSNWPASTEFKIDGIYEWEDLVNYSGKLIDVYGNELEDQKSTDVGLYIVRTGPCEPYNANDDGVGEGFASLGDSDFYVNAYVYNTDGELLFKCKTYELKNISKLLEHRASEFPDDFDMTDYAGKVVKVDYASFVEPRFDGEWYGVKSSETTVNISVQVALKNGTIAYQYDNNPEVPNVNETYGNAYINGVQNVDVQMGSNDAQLTVNNIGNYAFVGWYTATDTDKDGRYTIDITQKPLFNGDRMAYVEASGDAVYIAVFEELSAGSFTVYNQYYSHSSFDKVSPYAPIPQSENATYSSRYVEITKIFDASDNQEITNGGAKVLYKDSASLTDITEGDVIRIKVQTVPTSKYDYVYAWYLQADDAFGVNFEEIGSEDRLFDDTDKGKAKEFTFDYTVKEGERSLTVYSDIVHYSATVTLVYTYNNRYDQLRKYTVKYDLNDDEIANNHTPSEDNIRLYAPYVEDYMKDVTWDPQRNSKDGTVWTVTAVEDRVFDVNLDIEGEAYSTSGEFNESIDIYASDYNKELNTIKGVWYEEVGEPDGEYTPGTDKLIAYGNYLGLAITRDMNLVYTTDAELIYQIILDAPVYGREQDNTGTSAIDTIYADYLISYMIPHFHGDSIIVNGEDKLLEQDTDRHTPVQVQTLRDAGLTVEYGIITELINTDNPVNADGSENPYYGKDTHITKDENGELALDSLINVLNNEELDVDANGKGTGSGYAEGVGVYEGNKLMTYFYVYNAENISNKNRVLKTFEFENPTDFLTYYYNVYGYLVISDGTETHYYISNVQTLSIDEALEQKYTTTTNS